MESLLVARNLTKDYGKVRAVRGIGLTVEPGSCLGLLGPNGAGKTTTLEMLEGITSPSGGEILYRGAPLGTDFRNSAGIMFQETALAEFITVRETLQMFASLYPRTRALDELVERCALQEYLDRDNRRLSGGQRQRMLLAIALVNDPDVLFLDEPTTGLDPQARHNFWSLIEDIKAEGKTVLLSTHYMEEAYTLCDEIAIMDHGEIIALGTPDALLARHFNDVVLQLPLDALPTGTRELPMTARRTHDSFEIETGDVNAAIAALLKASVPLDGLRIRSRTLEDLFLELTGKELRG
ncbi:MAG: ABC transporter ATP-binding protein [Acidihalobacter sp.]|uniref:ABC transporter ATP-binding protein n=1 Tax=Acidihalobacter sp. TaxID=1872108 RepID=UPI00307CE761